MAIYKKVTDLVGNTPILELGNYEEKNQDVYKRQFHGGAITVM